jgi:RES domain-containing protein
VSRRSLIERIGTVPSRPFRGLAYRSASPGYAALSGEGARLKGGRWNPPDSFPVLYVATDPSAAAAEIKRTARRYGVALDDLLPRILTTIGVRLEIVQSEILDTGDVT